MKNTEVVNSLGKIKLLLIIIICILISNTLIVAFKDSSNNSTSTPETESTEDYDVSSFNSIDETKFLSVIKKSEPQVIYLGRATCGYCVKFLPVMQKAQNDLKFTTNYIDITTVDEKSENYETMVSSINDLTDSFNKKNNLSGENAYEYLYGYTPLVVIAKDGKMVDVWVGYGEYDSYVKWLNDNGIK